MEFLVNLVRLIATLIFLILVNAFADVITGGISPLRFIFWIFGGQYGPV